MGTSVLTGLPLLALSCVLLSSTARADDRYGIGSGITMALPKSTLEVSFLAKDAEGYPSCLLHFDGIARHQGALIRYTGGFGRTNKYLEFQSVLILSTYEIDSGNRNVTPSRSYYGYIYTPYFSSREKLGKRVEADPATVVLEIKDRFWMGHLFFSMLETKSVTLAILKVEGGKEEFMPPIDLTVAETSPVGAQVHSNAAMDEFRKCMHLENAPPQPGQEYRFFR